MNLQVLIMAVVSKTDISRKIPIYIYIRNSHRNDVILFRLDCCSKQSNKTFLVALRQYHIFFYSFNQIITIIKYMFALKIKWKSSSILLQFGHNWSSTLVPVYLPLYI